jgi:hypothetical protein
LWNWVNADREARARAADPRALSESEREELNRLRKENADLKMDREILHKAAASSPKRRTGDPIPVRLQPRRQLSDREALRQRRRLLLRLVAWASRGPSDRDVADAHLENRIREIHHRSRRTYGAPRVEGQLRKVGVCVGRKRVARLMRDARLLGAHSRQTWRRGKIGVAPAPDRLHRDFMASRPDERWVADVTECKTGEAKLFLAGVRDLFAAASSAGPCRTARPPVSSSTRW